jgi:hypothetical protein
MDLLPDDVPPVLGEDAKQFQNVIVEGVGKQFNGDEARLQVRFSSFPVICQAPKLRAAWSRPSSVLLEIYFFISRLSLALQSLCHFL